MIPLGAPTRRQTIALTTAVATLLTLAGAAAADHEPVQGSCPAPPATPSPTESPRQAYRRLAVPPPGVEPSPAAPSGTVASAGTDEEDCLPSPATLSSSQQGKPGAYGLGDPYFPAAGNGGYDVSHYKVTLSYKNGHIDASVNITARATPDLSSFSLDYRGPNVTSVTVDGRPAPYERKGQELIVTPAATLPRGQTFTVVVRYAGEPGPVRNNILGTYGWVPTRDGAVTMSEPDGTPTWLPVNDHPRDKATYAFHITVPKGLQVLANGEPSPPVRKGDRTTYTWVERSPMTSYLAMIAIGRFEVSRGRAGRIPVITAVDPRFRSSAAALKRTTIAALKWESKVFGPYPFRTAGGIVDDPRLEYALETQERPVYAGFAPDDAFVVHELAHQWFGNSVSLTRWPDIWLNEGFATYAEWLWQEHRTAKAKRHRDTTKKIFKRYYRQPASSPIFAPPPGRPGRHDLFAFSVYVRGAMCLQALRERVGDKAFFRTLRAWTQTRRHGNGMTADFVALAERQSGKQLDKLFNAWLYKKGKPRNW